MAHLGNDTAALGRLVQGPCGFHCFAGEIRGERVGGTRRELDGRLEIIGRGPGPDYRLSHF